MIYIRCLIAALLIASAPAGAQQISAASPSNASNSFVTKAGGISQNMAAWVASLDQGNNVLNILSQASSSTDYTNTINALLGASKLAYLPYTGVNYQISATLVFATNSGLICQAGVKIVTTSSTQQMFRDPVGADNASIHNCQFLQSSLFATFATINGNNFSWINGGADHTGIMLISAANNCTVDSIVFQNNVSATAAVNPTNATYGCKITNNQFQNGASLGIYATAGAHGNVFSVNRTDSNARELIGIRQDSYDNEVSRNIAMGTGDNGISISGYRNRIFDNFTAYNKLTGLFIYGGQNTVNGGNISIGNGQAHNPAFQYYNPSDSNPYAGIEVSGAFGGTGQNNNILGNFADDDQATKTQAYGMWIGPGYGTWATATAYSANAYVYASGNVYNTVSGGTSGASIPACSTGTCSDGGVTWTFVRAMDYSSKEPQNNTVGPNTIFRFITAATFDQTANHMNTLYP